MRKEWKFFRLGLIVKFGLVLGLFCLWWWEVEVFCYLWCFGSIWGRNICLMGLLSRLLKGWRGKEIVFVLVSLGLFRVVGGKWSSFVLIWRLLKDSKELRVVRFFNEVNDFRLGWIAKNEVDMDFRDVLWVNFGR